MDIRYDEYRILVGVVGNVCRGAANDGSLESFAADVAEPTGSSGAVRVVAFI